MRHDTVVIRRRHRHATAASNDFFCVPFGARQRARLYTSDALCDDGGPAPSTQTAPTAPTARTAAERVSGIIFVVDAADASRFDEARQELHKLLSEPRLRGVPLLVLANKMDLPEVEAALGVAERDPRPDGARCAVQGACSLCGDGVVAALEW